VAILVVLLLVVVLFGRGKISDLMGDVAKDIKNFKAGLADEDDLQSEPNVVERDAPGASATKAPRQILEGAAQTEVRLDARREVTVQTNR
jgi:sec-independent protein translocase protein TatA